MLARALLVMAMSADVEGLFDVILGACGLGKVRRKMQR